MGRIWGKGGFAGPKLDGRQVTEFGCQTGFFARDAFGLTFAIPSFCIVLSVASIALGSFVEAMIVVQF
jgi:hypothetical protein